MIDTTHRALQNCGQIFRYGVLTRRCARDPSSDLRGALSPIRNRHHASITDPNDHETAASPRQMKDAVREAAERGRSIF